MIVKALSILFRDFFLFIPNFLQDRSGQLRFPIYIEKAKRKRSGLSILIYNNIPFVRCKLFTDKSLKLFRTDIILLENITEISPDLKKLGFGG